MKRFRVFISIILSVCVVFLLLHIIVFAIQHYNNPYLRKLKIPLDWKVSSLEKRYGEPIGFDGDKCVYDGFSILMSKSWYDAHTEDTRFSCVIIDDDRYKFTSKNIGIGTKRQEIEEYYKNSHRIKDLPENQCGYITEIIGKDVNSGHWIYFKFDENDCVLEIRITNGL